MSRWSTVPALVAASATAAAGCGSASSSHSQASSSRAGRHAAPHTAAVASAPRRIERLAAPAHPSLRTVRVPILTYHRVHLFQTEFTKSIPDETVEPATFTAEMDALASNGYHTVSQTQLFQALFDGGALPSKPVLISVDDGYVDDVKSILPVLRSHHMVATFYVITGRFHEQGFLNETEVRRLDDAGMDIGAHTRTHVPLNAIPPAQVPAQVEGSRRDLQRVLGHFVYWFAYPYGAFSPGVVQEVRKAGFLLATTTKGGTVESATAPLTLPRIHVGRSGTAASVLACVKQGGCGGGGT